MRQPNASNAGCGSGSILMAVDRFNFCQFWTESRRNKKPGKAPVSLIYSYIASADQKKPLRCHQPAFFGLLLVRPCFVDMRRPAGDGAAYLGRLALRRDGRGARRLSRVGRRLGSAVARAAVSASARRRCRLRLGNRFTADGQLPAADLFRPARCARRLASVPSRLPLRLGSRLPARTSSASLRLGSAGDRLRTSPVTPSPSRLRPAGGCACRRACRAAASCARRRSFIGDCIGSAISALRAIVGRHLAVRFVIIRAVGCPVSDRRLAPASRRCARLAVASPPRRRAGAAACGRDVVQPGFVHVRRRTGRSARCRRLRLLDDRRSRSLPALRAPA